MLELFKNIFGQSDHSGPTLPESLIADAIERTVDGTDPRVRIVSGYARTLRRPVIHAVKYIIDLVDSFPAPVTVTKDLFSTDPVFSALFYSSREWRRFWTGTPRCANSGQGMRWCPPQSRRCWWHSSTEKRSFGTAQVGDKVMSDVPRTTVSFDQHRLLEPAASEQETRRLLKYRAFDYLVSIALAHVTERKEERDNLGNRKALLRSKLDIVRRGKSFSQPAGTGEHAKLQASLDDIEQHVGGTGPGRGHTRRYACRRSQDT